MNNLERHIEILLLNNDCVVVPGLGGFVAHHMDARYDEQDGSFLPPFRTLGFNPQLTMNDSLLAQSYVEAYDISYPEALKRIEHDAEDLLNELHENGEFELYNIGRLFVNQQGKTEFEPCEAGILTPEYYGLGSFCFSPLHSQTTAASMQRKDNRSQQRRARIVRIDTDAETGQKRVSVSMKALRNTAVAAVFIAAFFMMGQNTTTAPSAKIRSGILTDVFSHDNADKTAAQEMADKTAGETAAPAASQTAPVNQQQTWSIVLCSHVSKKNAEVFVEQLAAEGINGNIAVSSKGVVKVLYGNFISEEEAQHTLLTLRESNKKFAQGWVTAMD